MQRDRRKIHREIVKRIQKINKQIGNDDYLGLDRFFITMKSEDWYRYPDGSGGRLLVELKIADRVTNNFATFLVNNYDYDYRLFQYLNDFLVRCSSGKYGHFPPLPYISYDVHEIVSYDMRQIQICNNKDGIINRYDWSK